MSKENIEDYKVKTDHPRIFYKEKADKFDRGELEIAKRFAEVFTDWTIGITMGHR